MKKTLNKPFQFALTAAVLLSAGLCLTKENIREIECRRKTTQSIGVACFDIEKEKDKPSCPGFLENVEPGITLCSPKLVGGKPVFRCREIKRDKVVPGDKYIKVELDKWYDCPDDALIQCKGGSLRGADMGIWMKVTDFPFSEKEMELVMHCNGIPDKKWFKHRKEEQKYLPATEPPDSLKPPRWYQLFKGTPPSSDTKCDKPPAT
jgi:hypothetical protein